MLIEADRMDRGEERRRSARISARKRRRSDESSEDITKPKMPKCSENFSQESGRKESVRSSRSSNSEDVMDTGVPPAPVPLTLNDPTHFMNGEFRLSINQDMDKKLAGITERVDKNQRDLSTHKAYIEGELKEMRRQLTDRPVPVAAPPIQAVSVAAAATIANPKSGGGREEREARQYWRARRSARFFPVHGENESELRASLAVFLEQKMKIPTGEYTEEDVEHIRRVRMRYGKESVGEVTVLFSDIETRDRITSYARNLAPFVDITNKPTAGVRFEIPDHLNGVHRTLLQYGHAMWKKYDKDPGLKRNVRHDDVTVSYCLDIKFPNRLDWITVSYARALADRKANSANETEDRGDLLSTAKKVGHTGETLALDRDVDGPGVPGTSAAGGSVTSCSWRAPV